MIVSRAMLPKGLKKFVSRGWFRVDLASRDSSGHSGRCTRREHDDGVHHLGVMLRSSWHVAPPHSRSVLQIDTNNMTAAASEVPASRDAYPAGLEPVALETWMPLGVAYSVVSRCPSGADQAQTYLAFSYSPLDAGCCTVIARALDGLLTSIVY